MQVEDCGIVRLAKPLAGHNLLLEGKRLDMETSPLPSTTTSVEIFGAVYQVRGTDDGGYLQGLAELVDRRMRDIAQHVASGDTARIAILAALNLADELFRLQRAQEEERVEIREKMAELTQELARALEG